MMLINNTVGVALNGVLLLAYDETEQWTSTLEQVAPHSNREIRTHPRRPSEGRTHTTRPAPI
jgi:hypothetical protein